MILFVLPLLLFFVASAFEVNLSSKIKLYNPKDYYAEVLQESFYELEERGFCNLRLVNFNQTLNETLYNWHVVGDVSYYNGFVVSVEKIVLTELDGSTSTNQAGITTASFSAKVNMWDVRVGYDVDANLATEGFHRFTGIFTHSSIEVTFYLWKNMNTDEWTSAASIDSVSSGSGVRMVYMPESSVSEVLSRRFQASSTLSNVGTWAREMMIPIILEKAEQVKFPEYCLNC